MGPGDQTLTTVTRLDNDRQAPVFNTLTEKDTWKTAFLGCLAASFWYDQSHNSVAGKKLHSVSFCQAKSVKTMLMMQIITFKGTHIYREREEMGGSNGQLLLYQMNCPAQANQARSSGS